jgi:hypothetical protein
MGSKWKPPKKSAEQIRRDTILNNLANYYTRARMTADPNCTLTLFTDAAWLIRQNKATTSAVTLQLTSIVANFPYPNRSVNASGFVDYVEAAFSVGYQAPQNSSYFLSEFRNLDIKIDNPARWNSFLNTGAQNNYFNTWDTNEISPNLSSWENNFSSGNVLVMKGDASNNAFNGGNEQNIYYFNLDSNFGSDRVFEESSLSTNDTVLFYTEYQDVGTVKYENLLFSKSNEGHLVIKFKDSQNQVTLGHQFQSYPGHRIENIRFSTPTSSFTLNTDQLISTMSQIGVNQDRSVAQLMQINPSLNWINA